MKMGEKKFTYLPEIILTKYITHTLTLKVTIFHNTPVQKSYRTEYNPANVKKTFLGKFGVRR